MVDDSNLSRKATVIRGWVTSRNTITLHDKEFVLSGGTKEHPVPFFEIDSIEALSPSKAVFVHKGDRIEIRLPGPRPEDYIFLKELWDRVIASNPTVKHNTMVAAPRRIWLEDYRGILQFIGGIVGAGLLYVILFFVVGNQINFTSYDKTRWGIYLIGFFLGYGITWLVLQPIISLMISVKGHD